MAPDATAFNQTDYVRGIQGAGIVADLRAYHGLDPVPGPEWELAERPGPSPDFQYNGPSPLQPLTDTSTASWVGPPPIKMEVGKRYECQFSDCCTGGTFTGEYVGDDKFINVELELWGYQVVGPEDES